MRLLKFKTYEMNEKYELVTENEFVLQAFALLFEERDEFDDHGRSQSPSFDFKSNSRHGKVVKSGERKKEKIGKKFITKLEPNQRKKNTTTIARINKAKKYIFENILNSGLYGKMEVLPLDELQRQLIKVVQGTKIPEAEGDKGNATAFTDEEIRATKIYFTKIILQIPRKESLMKFVSNTILSMQGLSQPRGKYWSGDINWSNDKLDDNELKRMKQLGV